VHDSLQPTAGDPHAPDRRVAQVWVVFKTHLDLGFTDFAENVRRRYLDEFFPRAIETARTLRDTPDWFVWTTGSFILGEALRQGDVRRRRAVERAVRAGDLAWHALPFTTHTELLDESLLAFGLGLSRQLDLRFNRVTRAGKFTDVPGHTIGAVPVLAAAGIRLVHIGVNAASTPPSVPDLFRFGPDPGREILVLYQKHDYGAVQVWPELGVALALAHAGDNHGPPSVEQVHQTYADLRRRFPQARIEPGRLDDLAGLLWPIRLRLPAVRKEIGDTWIHGAATDPWKIAALRELSRLRRAWLASGRLAPDGRRHEEFSRALLCVAEHTWGLDVKGAIGADPRYAAADFARLRREAPARRLERSWREQRGYIRQALATLGSSPLATEARAALRALRPAFRQPGRVATRRKRGALDTPHFRVILDRRSGALRRLTARHTGEECADQGCRLGQVWLEVFGPRDYARFAKQYLRVSDENRWWAIPDFCKPGLETVNELSHRQFSPTMVRLTEERSAAKVSIHCWLAMPREAVDLYGAPARWQLTWVFPTGLPVVDLAVDWFDKPASRIPQAIWCSFVPRLNAGARWRFDKLGQTVDPRKVVLRGNRRLHAVGDAVTGFDRARRVRIETMDAPLVAPGRASLLDFHQGLPSSHDGVHVNLYNNVWGTNFPLWYEESARFRFRLWPGSST
jgi:hypothetical protein